jgi:hypothetical protein
MTSKQPTLRDALSASPSLFPFNMEPNGNSVQFVSLAEADYREASFLDNRMLKPNVRYANIPWTELSVASHNLPIHCDFIFHISHAGSTLLSRLLGSHPSCFSLREPSILRMFAQGAFLDRLDLFLGLWSRTFNSSQRALIKATSFVSDIGLELMTRVLDARAILMYVPPETFLSALLDGSMVDVASQAESRLQRLQRRQFLTGLSVDSLSPGECVAMSWLSEMTCLSEIASQFPTRTLWIDFDRFLEQSETMLSQSFSHLGLVADSAAYLRESTMQRYAKKPEVNYDAAFRSKLLDASRQKFHSEISRGLAWLEQDGVAEVMKQLAV